MSLGRMDLLLNKLKISTARTLQLHLLSSLLEKVYKIIRLRLILSIRSITFHLPSLESSVAKAKSLIRLEVDIAAQRRSHIILLKEAET